MTRYEAWGQFQQQFTSSFNALRSKKRRKDNQVEQLFGLSGSVCVKAEHKHIDEINPSRLLNELFSKPGLLVAQWIGTD